MRWLKTLRTDAVQHATPWLPPSHLGLKLIEKLTKS